MMKKQILLTLTVAIAFSAGSTCLLAQTITHPAGSTSRSTNASDVTGAAAALNGGTFINEGTINKSGGTAVFPAVNGPATTFINRGTLNLSGASGFAAFGGAAGSSTVIFDGGHSIGTGAGFAVFTSNVNDTLIFRNGSSVSFTNGALGILTRGGADTITVSESTITGRNATLFTTGAGADTLNLRGSMLNHSGAGFVTLLGTGNDVINFDGFSKVQGIMNVGPGANTINFRNFRGFTAADEAALEAGTALGGGRFGATINGQLFVWTGAGTTINASGFQPFSTLITAPGLGGFSNTMDNIGVGATDSFLDVLILLNAIPEDQLNAAAQNFSGQIFHHAYTTYGFNQASAFSSGLHRQMRQFNFNAVEGAVDATAFNWNERDLAPMLEAVDQNLMAMSHPGLAITDTGSLGTATMAASAQSGGNPNYDWQTFIMGSGGIAEQDATDALAESEYVTTSATVGVAKPLSDSLSIGAYTGYQGVDADVDAFGSTMNGEGAQVGGFARYQWEDLLVSGIVGYNYMSYDNTRQFSFGGINRSAESDPDSHQLISSLELAKMYHFGSNSEWRVMPAAGIQYSLLHVGGYSESGMGGGSLRFGDQTAHSLRTKLGGEVSRVIEGSWGWVAPYVSAYWNHEILDNSRDITTSFSDPALSSFDVSTEKADANFGTVGVGFNGSLTEAENIHFTLGWQVQFGQEGYLANSATGGFRIDL
jgi:uncharacterized protein YhjY with autotransporter beta-barrel domain